MTIRRLLPLLVILVAAGAVWGEFNFPLPQFSSGYSLPLSTTPGAREQLFSYVDVAVLVLALSLAAYCVLRLRSRQYTALLVLFSLLYFGFFRKGCVCSIGAIQNVAQALVDPDLALPLVVGAFFLLPLLFALFFGRVFCAAVCPLGAAQDLVLLRPIRVRPWLEHVLGTLPYLYLGVAVLFAATSSRFLICVYDPFVPFFRLSGEAWIVITGGAMLLLGVMVGRPYCRFLCPYGVLLRWLAPFSRWQVKLTEGDCVACRLCAQACPFGAIRTPTPPAPPAERPLGKRRLGILLLALPFLIAAGTYLGYRGSPTVSLVHPTVALANRVWLEQNQQIKGTNEGSEAFYKLGTPNEELYAQAAYVRALYDIGTPILGGWIGLVIGLRLIFLSLRRHRARAEIDQAACVACGRCLQVCPVEKHRQEDLAASEAGS